MNEETQPAISVRQPWASLIVLGLKPIENRLKPCPQKYFGKRVLIHASSGMTKDEVLDANEFLESEGLSWGSLLGKCSADLPRGGVIGSVIITGQVTESKSAQGSGAK